MKDKDTKTLKLYYVRRYDAEYDEYRAFVCAANSDKEARETHPTDMLSLKTDSDGDKSWYSMDVLEWDHKWTTDTEGLYVKCIGTFNGVNPQVIMADFYNG